MNPLAKFIKKRRTVLMLTQSALAKQCGWKTAQFVSNIERGTAMVPPDKIRKMAEVLKVDVHLLLKQQTTSFNEAYRAKALGKK